MEIDRSGKFVELVGSGPSEEAFHKKVGQRRWGVALVTVGISRAWFVVDVRHCRSQGVDASRGSGDRFVRSSVRVTLAFGFTQAFLGFLVLAEGHETLKITNTLDENTPLASTAVVMPVFNEDAETVFGNIRALYNLFSEREVSLIRTIFIS